MKPPQSRKRSSVCHESRCDVNGSTLSLKSTRRVSLLRDSRKSHDAQDTSIGKTETSIWLVWFMILFLMGRGKRTVELLARAHIEILKYRKHQLMFSTLYTRVRACAGAHGNHRFCLFWNNRVNKIDEWAKQIRRNYAELALECMDFTAKRSPPTLARPINAENKFISKRN